LSKKLFEKLLEKLFVGQFFPKLAFFSQIDGPEIGPFGGKYGSKYGGKYKGQSDGKEVVRAGGQETVWRWFFERGMIC